MLWLGVREGGGIVVRLLGVLLLTQLLGPAEFGVYAGGLALVTVLATAAQMSTEVYLVRRPEEPDARAHGTVYALLLLVGGGATALALVGTVVAADLGLREGLLDPFRILLLGLVLNVLWAPAQAALERAFRYRSLGLLELGGDVVLYAVALPLAVAGYGAAAAAWGYVAWQAFLLVGSALLAGLRPRLHWDRQEVRSVLRFAVGYAPVSLLPRLVDLVNPVVVGALAGAAAVGQVALANRLVQTVGFVARTSYRVALVVLASIRDDVPRLARAFREGLGLQALGLGVPLAGLCVVAPVLVPLAFGEEWRPVLQVLPLLALTSLVADTFALHAHVVTVRGDLGPLARAYVGGFLLRLAATAALLPLLGLVGVGLAGLVGLLCLLPLHRAVSRAFPARYDDALPWVVLSAPLCLVPLVPGPVAPLLAVPGLAVALHRPTRQRLSRQVRDAVGALRSRGAPTPS